MYVRPEATKTETGVLGLVTRVGELGGPGLPEQATLVVAEPYYVDCEGQPPWAHLRFWAEKDLLLQHGLVSADARILPCSGTN